MNLCSRQQQIITKFVIFGDKWRWAQCGCDISKTGVCGGEGRCIKCTHVHRSKVYFLLFSQAQLTSKLLSADDKLNYVCIIFFPPATVRLANVTTDWVWQHRVTGEAKKSDRSQNQIRVRKRGENDGAVKKTEQILCK